MGLDEKMVAEYERRLGERADSLERYHKRIAELEAQIKAAQKDATHFREQFDAVAGQLATATERLTKLERWLAPPSQLTIGSRGKYREICDKYGKTLGAGTTLAAAIDAIKEEDNAE